MGQNIFVVQQYNISQFVVNIFVHGCCLHWVKVLGKVALFVVQRSNEITNILPHENYPLYGNSLSMCAIRCG